MCYELHVHFIIYRRYYRCPQLYWLGAFTSIILLANVTFQTSKNCQSLTLFLSGAEFTNIWDVCTIRYSGVQLNCAFSRTVIHDRFMYIIILNIIFRGIFVRTIYVYMFTYMSSSLMLLCSDSICNLLCAMVLVTIALAVSRFEVQYHYIGATHKNGRWP